MEAEGGQGGPPRRRRVLGVVGTMVWDRIQDRDQRRTPVEEWGGISYALQALSACLDDDWEILPIVKVGADLSEAAVGFLSSIPGLDLGPGLTVVPVPNNRVELRYVDAERRTERLEGGVPPWLWAELAPLVRRCDALYVNFISGFEMELDTALSLRSGYDGPIYADLHSLFLGIGRRGDRYPRELPGWQAWLRSFDAVQMNEDEFELLGRAWGDPWHLAAGVVGSHLKLVTVTLGERGAAYVAAPDFGPDPLGWPGSRDQMGSPGTVLSRKVPPPEGPQAVDPTGCGDVWGSTLYGRLLSGDSLEAAAAEANRMAARNAAHRGAQGLYLHLRGRLAPGERQ